MERVFVAGSSAFTIREAAGLSAGTLTVTIGQDDRLEWIYQLASWRLADTVRRAWWTGAGPHVEDARETTTALPVAGDRLVVVTPGQFMIGPRP